MAKNKVPVVIQRKDKRLKKGLHLAAFMITGGASAPVSVLKGMTNASYNGRTRRLAEEAAESEAGRTEAIPDGTSRRDQLHRQVEQARAVAAGLTYRECKPGRDAAKAARRAGKSPEEAHLASLAALAEVRRQKYGDAPGLGKPGSPQEERLAAITRLRDQGLITEEEYQAKRAQIIADL